MVLTEVGQPEPVDDLDQIKSQQRELGKYLEVGEWGFFCCCWNSVLYRIPL